MVQARDADGAWVEVSPAVRGFDSVLSELADPDRTPEVIRVRDQMRAWRFYDQLRTDAAAPARRGGAPHAPAPPSSSCSTSPRPACTPTSSHPSPG